MKGKVAIEKELCKGCGYCVISCPKGVLAMDSGFNLSGYFPALVKEALKCTGCALCAEICPEIAIKVWRQAPPKAGTRRG